MEYIHGVFVMLGLKFLSVLFPLHRNEDGLKTKRISLFTTRGRQRSGTETGVCSAGETMRSSCLVSKSLY